MMTSQDFDLFGVIDSLLITWLFAIPASHYTINLCILILNLNSRMFAILN